MAYCFHDDEIEKKILHDSTDRIQNEVYKGSGLKRRNYKKIKSGGELPPIQQSIVITATSEPTPINKDKRSAWQILVQSVLQERKKGLKDAIAHIKQNNLYKK